MDQPKTLTAFIWHFVKKQKACFIITQIFAFAWSLDITLWPYAFKLLIDKITLFTGDKSEVWSYLMPVLIFWGLLWVIIDIMFRVSGFMMARAFPRMEADIRMTMIEYVTGHSSEFFANNFAGNIANRINNMTQSATRIIQLIITLFLPALLALILAGMMFFTIHYLFALLLLGWALLHIGISLLGAPRCSLRSSEHADARSKLTGEIVDSFTNIISVKLFAKRREEYQYIKSFQDVEKERQIAALTIVEKIKVVLGVSALVIPGIVMTWYLIYSWQHNRLNVGDVVLILNTSWNIQSIAWLAGLELPNLFREIGVCQQALTLMTADHDIVDKPNAQNMVVTSGEINFNNVDFYYSKGKPVFNKFNINIKGGSKVGLVGFSGSGKSTFVNLILRFYDIKYGFITIDGVDIRDVYVESLRKQISMIPQSPSLFHRSLIDNIRYAKPDATHSEIIAAAKHSYCHEFINSLPQGYDSLVGERGIKLSGGQRQRVAIARAILENAPILILDEATSALDSVTEKHIQDALHYVMTGRTTIVIAHRLSTLSEMDRILVFNKGEIVEDGTHDDLINLGGHYATMWQMQAGGFLIDVVEE